MDNRLSTKAFLRAFDYIVSNGEKRDNQYVLDGVNAWHDYDGYTCWLGYKDVTVTLMFHGTLKIDYQQQSHYLDFIDKCRVFSARTIVH